MSILTILAPIDAIARRKIRADTSDSPVPCVDIHHFRDPNLKPPRAEPMEATGAWSKIGCHTVPASVVFHMHTIHAAK